jgi:CubicO group peptidase (beta-lactamase class C family)
MTHTALLLACLAQTADLDKAVTSFDPKAGGFGGSVLVAVGGKVLLEKGYGLADKKAATPIGTDALWDWASVSKQFTAAAALKLQDQKKLSLDDPISKVYKDAPADKAKVTIRQLLNHTSGLQAGFRNDWEFDARDRESFEKMLLKVPMESKPGEKWEYSNSSYALVAAIVERVSGRSFEDFCVDELFKPAGMKDATFIGRDGLPLARVPKIARGAGFDGPRKDFAFAYGNAMSWGYRGCGGAVATTRDMLAWDRALRGEKVLSKNAKEQLYAPALKDYALGWFVSKIAGGTRVEHGGGVEGVVTQYIRLLDEDIVVALACSYEPREHPQRLAEELIRIARKR